MNVDLEVVAEGVVLGLGPDALTQLQHGVTGSSAGLSVWGGGGASTKS